MSGKRKPSPESSLSPPLHLPYPAFYEDTADSKKVAAKLSLRNQVPGSGKTAKSAGAAIQRKPHSPLPNRPSTFDTSKLSTATSPKQQDASPPDLYDCETQSPGGASTTSSEGPAYVRTPGFEHHAQEIARRRASRLSGSQDNERVDVVSKGGKTAAGGTKKKKGQQSQEEEEVQALDTTKETDAAVPPLLKSKPKKEPLPMKLRALPQSFWQQPNQTCGMSPGTVYPVLPPLASCRDHLEHLSESAGGRSEESPSPSSRRQVSAANTDLLFSLFRGVEEQYQPRAPIVRRGRPKKPPSSLLTRVLKDDDPCLVSTVTESILPLIPDRGGQQFLANILRDGDKGLSLPALSVEHNYSQILSELVVKL